MIIPSFLKEEMGKQYSITEQEEILSKIKELVNSGYTQTDALRSLNVSQTAYYSWKRKAKARNAQLQEEKVENRYYVNGYHRLIAENDVLKQRVFKLEAMLGKILIDRELSSGDSE